MATLIRADELRERFDIDTEIQTPRLEPHIGSASVRLRRWVGAVVYDASVAAAQSGQDADTDTINALKNAEAHLAMHYALLGMQFAITSKGAIQTATASEGREVRRYLTPKEAGELATMYLDLAREIVDAYLVDDGTPAAGFEFVESECE